jgi:DNA-binding IclR family transcriptional regulator
MSRLEAKTSREKILEYLKSVNRPVSVKEIVGATKVNYNTARGCLYRLKKRGIVIRTEEGWVLAEKNR